MDSGRGVLLRDGQVIPLTNKAFETLLILVRNSGQVVKKEELIKEIWPDTFVEETNLTRNISVLRKVLGEGPSDNQYIQTIPKQGYRFVASVREIVDEDSGLTAPPVSPMPETAPPLPATDAVPTEPAAAIGLTNNASAAVAVATINTTETNPVTPMPPNSTVVEVMVADLPLPRTRSKEKIVFAVTFAVIMLLGIVFIVSRYQQGEVKVNPIQKMRVAKFTSSGKAIDAAISPDGKYVAYVVDDIGQQSLWIKSVETNGSLQIVAPANVSYQGLTFSPDGNHIFYNVWDKKHVGAIFRVSVLGGIPTKAIDDVMPTLAVSPDGRSIAFVRGYAKERSQALIVANIDGTNERKLVVRDGSMGGFWQPTWSPNGKLIACATGGGEQSPIYTQVITVSPEGGPEKLLTTQKWAGIKGLAWYSDGSGLIMTAKERLESYPQLWFLSYPDGEARQISNDVNGYNNVSITADSSALVSVQEDKLFNIWLVTNDGNNNARKITANKYEGYGLSWTPDGRIVYVSMESQNYDIWIMDKDGSNKKQLTTSASDEILPSVSADGKYVLYTSFQSGVPNIWRIDIDAKNPRQLTRGLGEAWPTCSPTDQTFVYLNIHDGKIWKMSIDGGAPELLVGVQSFVPAFSPDGKQLAFSYWDETSEPQQLRGKIISLDGTPRDIRTFDIPLTAVRSSSTVLFRWTPDGRALAYCDNRDGLSNVWKLPLDNDPAKPLTDFKEDQIFYFAWSRDGKQLACTRGVVTSDVVIMKDFR